MGLVFQYPEYQLFETTVFEDVCFGPKNQGLKDNEAGLRAFEALKSVNLKEEVYAEWIPHNGHDIRDNFYKCSVCGRIVNVVCGDSIKNYPYCHCGAKMNI